MLWLVYLFLIGGVIRKYHHDLTPLKVHYPTNCRTPGPKLCNPPKNKGLEISIGGVVRWKSCVKMVRTYSSFQIIYVYIVIIPRRSCPLVGGGVSLFAHNLQLMKL